jgi:hypothetical protein
VKRTIWGALGSVILLGAGCSKPSPSAPAEPKSVPLIQQLSAAKVEAPEARYVTVLKFAVAGEKREVLFMHPPSKATFPPRTIVVGTRLKFGIGVNEAAWDKPGDGVLFTVTASAPAKPPAELFSRYLNPKTVPADRRWIDVDLSLGQVAGPDVTLTLETSPGPSKNNNYDWSGWSAPIIVVPEGASGR